MLNFLKTSLILRNSNGLQKSPPKHSDARILFFHHTSSTPSRFTTFKVFDVILVLVQKAYWSTEIRPGKKTKYKSSGCGHLYVRKIVYLCASTINQYAGENCNIRFLILHFFFPMSIFI